MVSSFYHQFRVETQIESSALKRMAQNDGLYLPPDMVMGRQGQQVARLEC